MSTFVIRVTRTSLVALALLGVVTGIASAQGVTPEDTARSVGKMLERLPYYGVFDYIVFRVDRGTVYLAGYSYHPSLKAEAEMVSKMASGVIAVSNEIEVLPVSLADDRVRWLTFYRIYTDDFLSRYVNGGAREARREFVESRHFPGMQPVGSYPIHIIVKNGRTMLIGVVDSLLDRQTAEVRAREVFGAFEVENSLMVPERPSRF